MKIPQPQLRALIHEILPSDADLDAFCSDHFPDVYRRFSDGMQRVRKVTILLDHADHERLTDVLRQQQVDRGAAAAGESSIAVGGGPVRVLFMASNPRTTVRLELGQEVRRIEERLRAVEHRDTIEFASRWAVRPDDMQQALLEKRPHILHFSGHGTTDNSILLENESGDEVAVDKDTLVGLLRILRDNLRLVVLNACSSEPIAEAITQVVDCAIGMQQPITDVASIEFAAAFYRAIGFGRSLGEAYRLGCNALSLQGIPEAQTPRLSVKAGVNADTIFLVRAL
jgi:hypothetical protein